MFNNKVYFVNWILLIENTTVSAKRQVFQYEEKIYVSI